MTEIFEVRQREREQKVDISKSSFWYQRKEIATHDVESRVKAIVTSLRRKIVLRGVDKASGLPYSSKSIRHSHVYEQRPDPLVMYKIFPPSGGASMRIHLIAVTSHVEAFQGNESMFFEMLQGHFGESTNPMRHWMRIVLETWK